MPSIQSLPTKSYNKLLIDRDASTLKSHTSDLKSKHVATLATILPNRELHDDLEIHLLHRHFLLADGEAIVDKDIIIESRRVPRRLRTPLSESISWKTSNSPRIP
jgi:hypothetical protein